MRNLIWATLMLPIGCVSASSVAVCEGSLRARDEHTTALLADGGPQSQRTGARLIAVIDAGCED